VSSPIDRRSFLRRSAVLAGAIWLPASLGPLEAMAADTAPVAVPDPVSGGYTDADYWRFADFVQQQFEPLWSSRQRSYQPGSGGVDVMVNADLLLTHAVAAERGHDGPARQDERANIIARRLCDSPPWRGPGGQIRTEGSQVHTNGWVSGLAGSTFMHLVVETEVLEGLSRAWAAREQLGMPQETADLIRDRIRACVSGRFWRYPALRLNQISWYTRAYVAYATVTGDDSYLQRDLRSQVRRFVRGMHRPMPGQKLANLGPSYRFHYLPQFDEGHRYNLDSAEYANIVAGFLVDYERALQLGMEPIPASERKLVQNWMKRVLAGYWTHTGYMNWDTGLAFKRWHQGKKLGLAQQSLIGIMTCPSLRPSDEWAHWAKHVFDQGLDLYGRLSRRAGGNVPPPVLYGVTTIPQGTGSARLFGARMQSNAARAALLQLGERTAAEPPPLYALDEDIGRLAITTPRYNTAILARNAGAVPYGGIELARLFDRRQDPASGIGGRPPAAFGLVVRDAGGKVVLNTQSGRTQVAAGSPPLQVVSGGGIRRQPRAGTFRELVVTGRAVTARLSARTTHRFTRDWIETRWTVTRRSGEGRYGAEVTFPSWGKTTRVTPLSSAGRALKLRSGMSLKGVAGFHVESDDAGYVVVVRSAPRGTRVGIRHPSRQSSDPKPGRTLCLRIAERRAFTRAGAAVRIAVVDDRDEAIRTISRLR
jgi:hypothetical protein